MRHVQNSILYFVCTAIIHNVSSTKTSFIFYPSLHSGDYSSWLSEQAHRQEVVSQVCEKYKNEIPEGLLGRWGVDKFSYSEQYNLLFCRNQKVFIRGRGWVEKLPLKVGGAFSATPLTKTINILNSTR